MSAILCSKAQSDRSYKGCCHWALGDGCNAWATAALFAATAATAETNDQDRGIHGSPTDPSHISFPRVRRRWRPDRTRCQYPLLFERAASYVDRLKGTKPGDPPRPAGDAFERRDTRVAAALALPIQTTLLGRADEVIE